MDTRTGKILRTHHMSSDVIGQPMTYQADGKQYVAVQSGWGGVALLSGGPKMNPIFRKFRLAEIRTSSHFRMRSKSLVA